MDCPNLVQELKDNIQNAISRLQGLGLEILSEDKSVTGITLKFFFT
jgi:hypothetical protein